MLTPVNRFNQKPVKIATFWEPKTAVKIRVDRLVHYLLVHYLRGRLFFGVFKGSSRVFSRASKAFLCVQCIRVGRLFFRAEKRRFLRVGSRVSYHSRPWSEAFFVCVYGIHSLKNTNVAILD